MEVTTEYEKYITDGYKDLDDMYAVCDRVDCCISVLAGVCAGLVDSFFVGAPGVSKLGKVSDKAVDQLVMKFSKLSGWNPKVGNENNVKSAIGYLERKFRVPYDPTTVGGTLPLSSRNHHLKSLGHSPDLIGLIFSIIDQFAGTASFINDGKIITIKNEETGFELRGGNPFAKLFCGFCNWIGHIMSDIAGSTGSRGNGADSRGMGVPAPFMELFQLCNWGRFSNQSGEMQSLARTMEEVFCKGYDARFVTAQLMPVMLQDMMIRVFWTIKSHFYKGREWRQCVPNKSHGDLRIMLLIGNASLCLVDGIDAVIRSGGNAVGCILHVNIAAWVKLFMAAMFELRKRCGEKVAGIVIAKCKDWMSQNDIQRLYRELDQQQFDLKKRFNAILVQREDECRATGRELNKASTVNQNKSEGYETVRKMAEEAGVSSKRLEMLDRM